MKLMILAVCLLAIGCSGCKSFKEFFSPTQSSASKTEKKPVASDSSFGTGELNDVEKNYLKKVRQSNDDAQLQHRKDVFGY